MIFAADRKPGGHSVGGTPTAAETDLLNLALIGTTAKKWREANPTGVLNGENIRDMASINELALLSNLEILNSILMKNEVQKKDRFIILSETVIDQKKTLDSIDIIKTLKKDNNSTFIDEQKKIVSRLLTSI